MDFNRDTIVFSRKSFSAEKRSTRIRRIIISVVSFSILSVLAGFLRYRIPFVPGFIVVEFSLFFELLSSIAYGPIIGIAVCFLKSVALVTIFRETEFSILANFFIDSIFVAVTGYYYFKKTFSRSANPNGDAKKKRRKRIFIGGIIGMPFALVAQFFLTMYYVYPKLQTNYTAYGYTAEAMLESYAKCAADIASHLPKALSFLVPEITEMWQGVLFFNIPIGFFKMLFILLAVMVIYPFVSPYLHFRRKQKSNKKQRKIFKKKKY